MAYRRFVPRSITDRAFWESVRVKPAFAPIRAWVAARVAGAAPRPAMPAASDYLAARRSNDRRRLDRHWRGARAVLAALALDRCIRGPDERDDRLLDWLWAFATEATWVVSAHLPDMDLPPLWRPWLDLASCEMAAQLAEMRETLAPWMRAQSRTLADDLVTLVDRQVLAPFADRRQSWWWHDKPERTNNWAGVCAGAILAACESFAAQGQPRPAARARALEMLRLFIARAFTAHGECDEGMHYWEYGLGFACIGWSRLDERAFRAAVPQRRLREIADYPRRAHLAGNLFYAANDSGPRADASWAVAPWLAGALDDRFLAGWSARHPEHRLYWHYSQLLRAVDACRHPPRARAIPRPAGAALIPDQQAAILRVATARGELIGTLGGGHNEERHNHNDLGHAGVFLDGVELVPDLGWPDYRSDFFGPRRYTYLSASSRGHCCPLVDGQEQIPGAEAAARVLAWDEGRGRLELDLTAAYPREAGLRRWTRSLARDGAALSLDDQFRTRRPRRPILHVLYATEKPRVARGSIAIGALRVALDPAPLRARVVPIDPAEHLLRCHQRTLYRLELGYRTGADGALAIRTAFSALPKERRPRRGAARRRR
jgi:hypothetical protein